MERGRNYVLYGDVNIAPQNSAFKLGGYAKALTGSQAHFETDRLKIDLFAGQTSYENNVQEIRADGTSGPFDIASGLGRQ